MRKTLFKSIPEVGQRELLVRDKFDLVEPLWGDTLLCPSNAMLTAAIAFQTFTDFVVSLFTRETRRSLGGGSGGARLRAGYSKFIPLSIRQRIIKADQSGQLIRIR